MESNIIKLYYTDINTELSFAEYEKCIEMIDKNRADQIEKFHFEEDKRRSLYGAIMVRGLFQQLLGVSNSDLFIEKNQYGKPFFVGASSMEFNISHSGKYVLCGISEQKVGVDIEQINGYYESIARNWFTKQEFETINQTDLVLRERMFYIYWTLKESYVKYLGKGLSVSLDSFSIAFSNGKYTLESSDNDKNVKLYSQLLEEEYMIAATYSKEVDNVKVVYKNIREFL